MGLMLRLCQLVFNAAFPVWCWIYTTTITSSVLISTLHTLSVLLALCCRNTVNVNMFNADKHPAISWLHRCSCLFNLCAITRENLVFYAAALTGIYDKPVQSLTCCSYYGFCLKMHFKWNRRREASISSTPSAVNVTRSILIMFRLVL